MVRLHSGCAFVTVLLLFNVLLTVVFASSYNLDLNTASDYFPTVAETDTYSSTETGNGNYFGGADTPAAPSTRPTAIPEASQQSHVEVKTHSGIIRGIRQRMSNNRIVNTFLGIPYAEPPVGRRRFRNPEPIQPWPGVRNTTEFTAACYQSIDEAFGRHPGVEMWNPPGGRVDEDCLYANIWVPHRCLSQVQGNGSHRCAVLVWIYGGSFNAGSATLDLYNGALIASLHHVIVVSFNYRLGPFGFLYFGATDSAPGNMGLMDQQLALKWVHGNIDLFGGNKSQITLFGESAGAVSVSMHLFAKNSMPLFRNAVLQSGSLFGPWTVKSREFAKKRSLRLAELTGCFGGGDTTNLSYTNIAACMQNVSPRELADKQWLLQNLYFETTLPPVVDGHFLQESPQRSVEKGNFKKTNILLGANKDEGNYFLLYGLKKEVASFFPNEPTITREGYLNALRRVVGSNKLLYEMTKYVYDDSKMWRPSHLQVLNEVSGDREFLCPVVRLARLYAKSGSNVYMYHFTHRTSVSPWPEWMGVLHADEIEYIFGVPLRADVKVQQPNEAEADQYSAILGPPNSQRTSDGKFIRYPQVKPQHAALKTGGTKTTTAQSSANGYTYSEYRLSWAMTKFWTNFAKTDDPNIETRFYPPAVSVWPRFSLNDQKFIYFNTSRSYTIGKGLRHSECVYWENIAEGHLEPSGADGFGSESEAAAVNQATVATASSSLLVGLLAALLASCVVYLQSTDQTSRKRQHDNGAAVAAAHDGLEKSLFPLNNQQAFFFPLQLENVPSSSSSVSRLPYNTNQCLATCMTSTQLSVNSTSCLVSVNNHHQQSCHQKNLSLISR